METCNRVITKADIEYAKKSLKEAKPTYPHTLMYWTPEGVVEVFNRSIKVEKI